MIKRQKWTHWTPELKREAGKEIEKLIEQGFSMRQIEIQLGLTHWSIKSILEFCNIEYKRGAKAKMWTKEKYYELYLQIEQYLQMGWSYKKIAANIGHKGYLRVSTAAKLFSTKKAKEAIENELKLAKTQSDETGHSIELDSKMGWRKFNVEVRLLSCPVDKFKYRIVKCSAIQELCEYLDYYCPLNEFIVQFGDKKNEMFVFIDDIKRPLDQQTIYKLFY